MQNTRTKDSDLYRCNFNISMIREKEETKRSAKCHVAALEEEKEKKRWGREELVVDENNHNRRKSLTTSEIQKIRISTNFNVSSR